MLCRRKWLAFSAKDTPLDEHNLNTALSVDPTICQFTGEAWSFDACIDTTHDLNTRRVGRVVLADSVGCTIANPRTGPCRQSVTSL
jgi:hypothetical protein